MLVELIIPNETPCEVVRAPTDRDSVPGREQFVSNCSENEVQQLEAGIVSGTVVV
jgi:hypothetical protein